MRSISTETALEQEDVYTVEDGTEALKAVNFGVIVRLVGVDLMRG